MLLANLARIVINIEISIRSEKVEKYINVIGRQLKMDLNDSYRRLVCELPSIHVCVGHFSFEKNGNFLPRRFRVKILLNKVKKVMLCLSSRTSRSGKN